jgi:signal transduction histidine kinase/pSer/pThr/pTyr-binding forkhead associated (FHA) protein
MSANPQRSSPLARLIIIKGPDEGRQFELPENEPVSIGRDRNNRMVLHDTEVSRRHAEIACRNGIWTLRDVGSANGTLLNGQPIRELPIATGDHVAIGQTTLVFSTGRSERPSAHGDITNLIRLVADTNRTGERPSAIVKTVNEDEGSRILAKPEQAGTDWLRSKLANLSVMYETTQAVSHILDLDQLLEKILELVFNSIPADHGCIMIREMSGTQFEPHSVRFRSDSDSNQKMTVSRTIMDWVLQQKQGVLISDASQDHRFASGNSITRFNIREVICVPMKGRHETHGVLFLDTVINTKQLAAQGKTDVEPKLTEDHLALAIAIAHQAAMAVEETRYHQAMVSAERLAAVGQAIAALSHHIKNIMQGVVFGSDMVRAALNEKDDALMKKGWKLVEKNQGKIHDLVLDMLSISKDREPAVEMMDLNSVVAETIDIVQGRAEQNNVKLEVRLSPSLPRVPADPDGVNKALLNIVSNAIDAVEDMEAPYVGVQTLMEPGNQWIRIVVLDHGPGIAPEKINEIFRPFVSTKGSKGTGLGLPVSRKIFREHGGDITVESKPGKGSKFILRLPMKSQWLPDHGGTQEQITLPPED